MKKFLLILLVTLTGSSLKAQEVALSADFTKGTCNFIVADVRKPVAGTSVWSQSKDYGMVASGFVSGKNYDSESWLISPTIDLQGLSHSRMSINHAVNFFSNIGKAKEETEICVRTVGGEWTKITGLCYPDRMSWNFTECTDIDLSAFDGQYIQIGLHYVSTSTKAGTWEIKNVVVAAKAATPTVEHLYLLGGNQDWTWANNAELPFDETAQAWTYEVNSPESEHYFAFADKNDCASWDELNGSHRWALEAGDIVPEINAEYALTKVNGTVKLPAGQYTVTVTKDMKMTVKAITDGIRSIENSELRMKNSDYYNLAGQRVGKDYKGIVIVNGKKVLVK